jgi:hypothetical protein
MVCFNEMTTEYKMKGCSHIICTPCSVQMKNMETSISYPFSIEFTLKEAPVSCLKCPYCRQAETSTPDYTLKIPSLREYLTVQFKSFKTMMEQYPSYSKRDIIEDFVDIYDYETTLHKFTEYKSCLRKYHTLWMDSELRFDGEKSTIRIKYKRYVDGKRRDRYMKWNIYKGSDITLYDFIGLNRDYKHQKNFYIVPRTHVKVKDLRRMKRF